MAIDYTKRAGTPPRTGSPGGISFTKTSGRVSLDKRSTGPVLIKKTPLVRAIATWSTDTDYDLYAYVVLRDGSVHPVATFGAGRKERAKDSWSGKGHVRHRGDVGRDTGGKATEVIDIQLGEEVVAVVPVAYSAQSNGSGSFYRYRVSLAIDNGAGDSVTIDSAEASRDDGIYTCVPGVVYNHPEGVVVERLELYSGGGENRPKVDLQADGTVRVKMDAGPRNDYK